MKILLLILCLSVIIFPVIAGDITKVYDPLAKEITIKDNSTNTMKIKIMSVTPGLTTLEEIIQVTPLVEYTFTSTDFTYKVVKPITTANVDTLKIYYLTTIEKTGTREIVTETKMIYDKTNDTYYPEDITKIETYKYYVDEWVEFSPYGMKLGKDFTYTLKLVYSKLPETGDIRIQTIPNIFGVDIPEMTWWNSSWIYRKNFTVTSTSSLTNYQIRVNVYNKSGTDLNSSVFVENKVQPDWGDLRFVNSSGTELSYWIEHNTTNSTCAVVWVKTTVLNIGNNVFSVYYGNSTIDTTSNGTNTFVLYDDFQTEAQINTTWTGYGGNSYWLGGRMYLGIVVPSANSDMIYSKMLFGTNFAMRGNISFNNQVSGTQVGGFFRNSPLDTGSAFVTDALASLKFVNFNGGATSWDSVKMPVIAFQTYDVIRNTSTNGIGIVNDTMVRPVSGNYPTITIPVLFYGGSTGGSPYQTIVDWVFVRNYSAPEPVITGWVSEECFDGVPVSDFTSNVTSGQVTFAVQFTSTCEANATAWIWDFGDGTSNSTEENPIHEYDTAGTFNVALRCTNPCGSDWENKTSYMASYSSGGAVAASSTTTVVFTEYMVYYAIIAGSSIIVILLYRRDEKGINTTKEKDL